jgi:inosine triphosphate pyrophosphatase
MLDGFDTKDAWALCTFAYSAGPGESISLVRCRSFPSGSVHARSTLVVLSSLLLSDLGTHCTDAVLITVGTEPILFEGRTEGKLVPKRGPPNFGWDCLFEPHGTGMTYVFIHLILSIQSLFFYPYSFLS